MSGKPVPAGVPIKIARLRPGEDKAKPTSPTANSSATDAFGAYKLTVKQPGKCLLTIRYEKQTASLEVCSHKEATRYDLVLERKDGALRLGRK